MKEIDDSQLESEDVLQKPGKEGEVKLIKTSKGPYAYQYSGGVWVEVKIIIMGLESIFFPQNFYGLSALE